MLPGGERDRGRDGEKQPTEFGQAVLEGSGNVPKPRGRGLGEGCKLCGHQAAASCLPQNPLRPLGTLDHGELCAAVPPPQQRARKPVSFSKHPGVVGCTTPSVHTHCQPAGCQTEAVGEVDQVTNFHSDSC